MNTLEHDAAILYGGKIYRGAGRSLVMPAPDESFGPACCGSPARFQS